MKENNQIVLVVLIIEHGGIKPFVVAHKICLLRDV